MAPTSFETLGSSVPAGAGASSPRAAVVVLAGGSGTRAGAGVGKVYRRVAGVPLVMHSLWAAARVPTVTRLLLVVKAGDRPLATRVLAEHTSGLARGLTVEVVTGGSTRHGSEWAALCHLAPAIEAADVDVVAIHDGARPVADTALFAGVVRTAWRHGGALPTTPAGEVVAVAADGHLRPARSGPPLQAGLHLARVQTPQSFRAKPLLAAYLRAAKEGFEGTDTAACVARYTDLTIRTVRGSTDNLKVTYPDDVPAASRLLDPPHP